MTEERYTLTEASRILREDQCTQEGHSVLWIPIRSEGRELPDPTYSCIRCGRYCTVSYPHWIAAYDSFTEARLGAFRAYCSQSGSRSATMRGHEILPVPLKWSGGREFLLTGNGEETYTCMRCDALIEFFESPLQERLS